MGITHNQFEEASLRIGQVETSTLMGEASFSALEGVLDPIGLGFAEAERVIDAESS